MFISHKILISTFKFLTKILNISQNTKKRRVLSSQFWIRIQKICRLINNLTNTDANYGLTSRTWVKETETYGFAYCHLDGRDSVPDHWHLSFNYSSLSPNNQLVFVYEDCVSVLVFNYLQWCKCVVKPHKLCLFWNTMKYTLSLNRVSTYSTHRIWINKK